MLSYMGRFFPLSLIFSHYDRSRKRLLGRNILLYIFFHIIFWGYRRQILFQSIVLMFGTHRAST